MPIVRIEHSVPDFEKWKRVFDSDPADRKALAFVATRSFAYRTNPTT